MTTATIRKGRPFAEPKSPNLLRQYRVRANMTQEELAERIGVAQPKISRAEVNGLGLGNNKWFELADLFNVDPRVLRGWKPPEPETPESSSL